MKCQSLNRINLPAVLALVYLCICARGTLSQVKQNFQIRHISPEKLSAITEKLRDEKSANVFSTHPLDTTQSVNERGSELGVSLYQDDSGLQILFDSCPFWFVDEDTSPAILTLTQNFFTNLPTEQQTAVLSKKPLPITGLGQQDVERLKRILLFDTAPGTSVTAESIASLFKNKETVFRIRIMPEVFIADSQKLVGMIQLYAVNQVYASAIRKGELNKLPDWSRPPQLIIPPLPKHMSNLALQIDHKEWTIPQIANFISADGKYTVRYDKRLSDGKFYLSEGNWQLSDLIKALSIGLGVEFREIKDSLYIGPSPVHRLACTSVLRDNRYKAAEAAVNTFLQPRYQLMENQTLVKPFLPAQFLNPHFVPLSTLPVKQAQFIQNKFEGLPAKSQVRFLTELTFIIENKQDSNSISFFTTYGSPTDIQVVDKPLYPSDFYLKQYKTTVVN